MRRPQGPRRPSRRLLVALALDLRIQTRYLFPQFYLGLTVVYALILRSPAVRDLAPQILPVLLFSEPGLLGLYFAAAHWFFEQGQGTTTAAAVTPLRIGEFVLAKALSISLVSTLAGLILFGAVAGVDWRLLAAAPLLWLTAITFGLLGVGLAAYFADFTRFLFGSFVVLLPSMVPLLALAGVVPRLGLVWLPSAPILYGLTLLTAVGAAAPGQGMAQDSWLAVAAVYVAYLFLSSLWAVFGLCWATRAYGRRAGGLHAAPGRGVRADADLA